MAAMASIYPFSARAAAASSGDHLPSPFQASTGPSAEAQLLFDEIVEYLQFLKRSRPEILPAVRDMTKYFSGASMTMLGLSVWAWLMLT